MMKAAKLAPALRSSEPKPLWTIILSLEQLSLSLQLRAADVSQALRLWLRREPFRILLGVDGASTWPDKTDDRCLGGINQVPSMPGFYQGCISSRSGAQSANLQVVRTNARPVPKLPRLSVESLRPVIAALVQAEVARISKLSITEPYCALALVCNACYGDMVLSLNTPSCLHAFRSTHAAQAEFQEYAAYCTGDWSHAAVSNDCDEWQRNWQPRAQRIADCIDTWSEHDRDQRIAKWIQSFLRMLSELLVDMLEEKAFAALSTTADFLVFAIDHDESQLDALQRMREAHSRYAAKVDKVMGLPGAQ